MEADWGAVEAAGLLADAEDPEDRRALVAWLLERGFTLDQIAAAHERGGLIRMAGDDRIRPGAGTWTLEEVADRVGRPVEEVRRAWLALGIVDPGPAVRVASDDDVELVRHAVVLADVFGEQGWTTLRRFGALLQRVTEALSAAAISAVPDVSTLNSGSEVLTAQAFDGLASLVPGVGRLLDLTLRHHIDAVRRMFEASGAGVGGRTLLHLGIGFADLSGFTSTSLSVDLDELAALVGTFEAGAADVVSAHGGRVVKFVGDAALFVCPDPDALATMALELVQGSGGDDASTLPVRVGLTYGTVLARDGDFFGPAVNLAARLVDVAPQRTVVIDEDLRAALDGGRWAIEAGEPQSLRGIPEPVVPYLLRRA